jgi:alpha-ketoglutarate-dependent 2,4-dichlorophenoxyacetate dioxygenase
MSISIFPVTPDFAAEVGDVDLSQPLPPDVQNEIKAAFWKYAVLVFPEQQLTPEQHVAFATNFGPLETSIAAYRSDEKLRIRADLADVSNLNPENEVWETASRQRMFQLGNRLWHTDSTFRHVPALASLLYGRAIAPIGGHTEFADERAAWDALPESTRKRIDGLVAEHSIFTSRAKLGFHDFSDEERAAMPPVKQVLVRTLPENGRRSLYLASHAGRVIGMPEDEGRKLLDELIAHATQRQFIYTHRWRTNDLVMWDNRCTMHRGTDFDDLRWKRDMQRATVSDLGNSCESVAQGRERSAA